MDWLISLVCLIGCLWIAISEFKLMLTPSTSDLRAAVSVVLGLLATLCAFALILTLAVKLALQ